MENTIFYVYVYLDPRKPKNLNIDNFIFNYEPIYVGKGKDNRYLEHLTSLLENHNRHLHYKIKKIQKENKQPIIKIIKNNLNEKDAFQLEKDIIFKIGRLDLKTGSLCNLTNGGEGINGFKMSERTKLRISKSNKGKLSGNKNPFYNKHHSKEFLKAQSQRMKLNNPNYIPGVKEKISKANTGKVKTEQEKKNISKRMQENNPMKKPEIAKKVSNTMKRKGIGKGNSYSSNYWVVVSPNGSKQTIKNLALFSRKNKLNYYKMQKLSKCNTYYYLGWKCIKL